eukprot:1039533-Rhodomonas_salina.2
MSAAALLRLSVPTVCSDCLFRLSAKAARLRRSSDRLVKARLGQGGDGWKGGVEAGGGLRRGERGRSAEQGGSIERWFHDESMKSCARPEATSNRGPSSRFCRSAAETAGAVSAFHGVLGNAELGGD